MPDSHQHDLAELARMEPKPDIRLIAADLDGTLVDDEKRIHDEFWPLVDELHARGITFCPASGRQYYNLLQMFEDVAEEVVFLAENGTYVVARGKEISSDCMSLDVARRVCARVREIPSAGAVLCGKLSAYVERTDEEFLCHVRPYYARELIVPDLTAVEGDHVLKVAIYDFVSSERNAAPRLEEFRATQQVAISGPHWVDVMSPTANKGRALEQVQRALGVTRDQTMAFGDFLNDLEMMDAATYSFAMANAHPLLKERASWVAPTNNANGVVRTIRTVLGLG
jgi:Cof subfamily protein (haloacid dehalogenase superfamily)